ncbi:MAG TPA: hypothetical protein VH134_06845 [Candidatus Dormibacteraeota bacterium]|nr:hypothetical protein [Candidatus Dormibacteraeota bacterium]
MPPSAAEVLVGSATVVGFCVAGCYAARAALGGGNRLWLVSAVGCLLVVAGVVGQRTFPSADSVTRSGKDTAGRQVPGPWDAGVGIPVVGLHVTPVTLAGLLLSVAGTSLVLFFEAPPPRATGAEGGGAAALEDDDTV